MAKLKLLRPDIKVYLREFIRPIEIIQIAVEFKANGIDMNFWILNPLTYYLAKRNNL